MGHKKAWSFSFDRRLDSHRPQEDRQNPQRPRQSARPLAFRRHRSSERPPPPARRRDRDRRRISRHRAAAPAWRRRQRPPKAPLIGNVGALAVAHFYADGQGPFDEVDAPIDAKPTTVAVQIRGHSLGALFDNWLVFYDDIRNPPDESLVGRMCVCGLSDGRVLIKSLKRSPNTGLWNLLSNTEPPIYDAGLEWAAPVREMRPR